MLVINGVKIPLDELILENGVLSTLTDPQIAYLLRTQIWENMISTTREALILEQAIDRLSKEK